MYIYSAYIPMYIIYIYMISKHMVPHIYNIYIHSTCVNGHYLMLHQEQR